MLLTLTVFTSQSSLLKHRQPEERRMSVQRDRESHRRVITQVGADHISSKSDTAIQVQCKSKVMQEYAVWFQHSTGITDQGAEQQYYLSSLLLHTCGTTHH